MVWLIAWIIIPFLIGLFIWGFLGGVILAVLGVVAYYVQRIATINHQQKQRKE